MVSHGPWPGREQHVKIHAMPHASNLGVKIHYEVEGSGPPLVLAHGLGYSGEDCAISDTSIS
jgi:hypothetical protein